MMCCIGEAKRATLFSVDLISFFNWCPMTAQKMFNASKRESWDSGTRGDARNAKCDAFRAQFVGGSRLDDLGRRSEQTMLQAALQEEVIALRELHREGKS